MKCNNKVIFHEITFPKVLLGVLSLKGYFMIYILVIYLEALMEKMWCFHIFAINGKRCFYVIFSEHLFLRTFLDGLHLEFDAYAS